MTNAYIEGRLFDVKTTRELPFGEYDKCTFKGLNFSNLDVSQYIFNDCEFIDCNLTLVKIRQTAFRKVRFEGCKLMGLNFDDCNNFGMALGFSTCNITNCTFTALFLTRTKFEVCDVHDCDFTQTNLSDGAFLRCSLRGSTFERSNLEKVDFRYSTGIAIDPSKNKMRKAKFQTDQLPGLLKTYQLEIED